MKAILPKTRRIRPVRSGQYGLTIEWYFEGINQPLSAVFLRYFCG